MIFCMKILALSLMIVSIEREFIVLLILAFLFYIIIKFTKHRDLLTYGKWLLVKITLCAKYVINNNVLCTEWNNDLLSLDEMAFGDKTLLITGEFNDVKSGSSGGGGEYAGGSAPSSLGFCKTFLSCT